MRVALTREDRFSTAVVFIFSGLSGFLLGSFVYGTWQLAVESGQAIAGMFPYLRAHPFYIYHTKAWTLLHQLCVPFLRAGVSEKTLSFVFSGFIGMVSFQALAMVTWAFSRHVLLSMLLPFLVQFSHTTQFSTVYPVVLMGTSNTHGALALALVLLILGFWSNGNYKIAAFLLGIAPAIHLALGILCWLILFICVLWDFKSYKESINGIARSFFIGIAITALSALIQWFFIYNVPRIDPALAQNYMDAYIRQWDYHRRPVDPHSAGLKLNLIMLLLSVVWLKFFSDDLPKRSLFLLRAFIVSALLGGLFALLTWMPPEMLPSFVVEMMPARILELNTLAFPAFLIGIWACYRNSLITELGLIALLLVAYLSQNFSFDLVLASSAFLLLLPFVKNRILFLIEQNPWPALLLLLLMGIHAFANPNRYAASLEEYQRYTLANQKDSELFRYISGTRGVLLTAGNLHLIQLRTRHPVLLDGGQLDMLPYAIEMAPEIAQILRNVYGVDFFHYPRPLWHTVSIPLDINRNYWESRTPAQWAAIGKQFQATEVLTYQDWKLQLPLVAKGDSLVLYRIP